MPWQLTVKGQSRLADHGPGVPDEASHFHSLFPDFELFLLPEARHFPQLDESEEAAWLIHSAPVQGIGSAVAQTDTPASVYKVRVPVLPPGGRDA